MSFLNRNKEETISPEMLPNILKEDTTFFFKIESSHPELLKYEKQSTSVEKHEFLNKKKKAPYIGLGVRYISVAERPDVDIKENGKDIVMPMVSLSIPLFNKTYKSQSKQNELKQQKIEKLKQIRRNKMEVLLEKTIRKKNSARIQYETQKKNEKQLVFSEKIILKNYETGDIDFQELLDIQELQLQTQIKQIDAIEEFYVQTTVINYLTK